MTFHSVGTARLSTIPRDDVLILTVREDEYVCDLRRLAECLQYPSQSLVVPLSQRYWDIDRRRFRDVEQAFVMRLSRSQQALVWAMGQDLYSMVVREVQSACRHDGDRTEATISVVVRDAAQLSDGASRQMTFAEVWA